MKCSNCHGLRENARYAWCAACRRHLREVKADGLRRIGAPEKTPPLVRCGACSDLLLPKEVAGHKCVVVERSWRSASNVA